MGRLLILIFPKLADALLLARFAVSAPVRIRRDARVRTDSLRFDLTQTETLVLEKRLSLSLLLLRSPLCKRNGLARLLASMLS